MTTPAPAKGRGETYEIVATTTVAAMDPDGIPSTQVQPLTSGQLVLVSNETVIQRAVDIIEIVVAGPQGPRGPLGPHEIFIQPDEPSGVEETYLWVQTGLGPDGRGWTLWFKDNDL